MSTPPPEFRDHVEDISSIIVILKEIRDLLKGIINDDFTPLASSHFIRDQSRFRELLPIVDRRTEDAIQYIVDHTYDPVFIEQLRLHGLTGPELKLKKDNLSKLRRLYERFRSSTRKLRQVLSPLYKVMNSILGSIGDVVPGVKAIKEIKDHLEAATSQIGNDQEGNGDNNQQQSVRDDDIS